MKQYLIQLMSKIVPQIFLAIVVGSTLATGTVAGVKMIKANASAPDAIIEQVQPVNTETSTDKPTLTPTATRNTTGKAQIAVQATIASTATKAKVSQNNAQCVVTLFGKLYDVTSLRSSHPGGDVFVCETDMSATYQKTHGTDMSRMQAYLIPPNGSTGTTGTSQSRGINKSSFDDDDDEESQEEKSRYEDHKEEDQKIQKEVEKGE